MAKIRVMSNQRRVGAVGDTTYYVRDGEQIARQSRNNSNYGEGASRSEAQMRRRVKWANLVNFYKACAFWMPKAFESVKQGQTMYNKFMQLNINEANVCLTKDMAQSGCCCVEAYQVAKGTFPRIEISTGTDNYGKKAAITVTQAISASTTVAQFSADIIANNLDYQDGDNLALVYFNSFKDASGYPYVQTRYMEVTLNSTSTALLSASIPFGWFGKTSDNKLGIIDTQSGVVDDYESFALIKTRKINGSLKVSTAFIEDVDSTQWSDYTGAEWQQTCIDSYGVDPSVPLDPNFKPGTIQSVTANGVAVENGQFLSGSQELRVYTDEEDNVRVVFDGVEFTPLFRGDGYLGYIIGANGACSVYQGENVYLTFYVDDVVVPEGFPTTLKMEQVPTTSTAFSQEGAANLRILDSGYCINYAFKKSNELPYFLLNILGMTLESTDIELTNCAVEDTGHPSTNTSFNLSVISADSVAYVTYQGVIIAVFNYTS